VCMVQCSHAAERAVLNLFSSCHYDASSSFTDKELCCVIYHCSIVFQVFLYKKYVKVCRPLNMKHEDCTFHIETTLVISNTGVRPGAYPRVEHLKGASLG
jgi:hypothetical protein